MFGKYFYLFIAILFSLCLAGCTTTYTAMYCGTQENAFNINSGIYVTEISILNEKDYDPRPYMVGGIDSLKSKLWYPEIPRRANISGDVILKFDVDESGSPGNILFVSSPWTGPLIAESGDSERDSISIKKSTAFDKIVGDAILATKFTPAYKNNKPVKSRLSITVAFYSKSVPANLSN